MGERFLILEKINNQSYFKDDLLIHFNTISAVFNANVKKYLWFSSCTGYPDLKKA